MYSSFRPENLELLEKLEKGPVLDLRLENIENHISSLIEDWKSWKSMFFPEEILVIGLLSQLF